MWNQFWNNAGGVLLAVLVCCNLNASDGPINISGIYPHLAMYNDQGECGTGAVVPWQGSLWVVTYSPHRPAGSSDKLYEITPDLARTAFAGSVGGTPANRMIHRESNQLLIGPYLIDARKQIRVIPPSVMFGRLTGTARHLTDPAHKVYYATMEEGLYEVDLATLDVKCLIRDGNSGAPEKGLVSQLPGYHGKGFYSGQGRVVYANNGDRGPRVHLDPTVASGALAQWFGAGDWQLVRRNQFTEVSGPGGIAGSVHPDTDPIWSLGWDARSLILALLQDKTWHYYRLPKGSHSYDGAHGWNTEWPRIRAVGEKDLLATMHGTFWRFPVTFSLHHSAGIAPRSNYLKVVGDFCRWNDKIVLGCDDSAKSEFLNTRPFKARQVAALESNSNLWFVAPRRLDELGPAIGRGSVWLREEVRAGLVSDPFLFSGYDYRQLHLSQRAKHATTFTLEVDRDGSNRWHQLREITVPAGGSVAHIFTADETGPWVRLVAQQMATGVTANFQYRNRDRRTAANDPLFAGIAQADQPAKSYALMRSVAHDRLGIVADCSRDGQNVGYYELNQKMELVPVPDPSAAGQLISAVHQPENVISVDAASVILEEDGKRYRLPKDDRYVAGKTGPQHDGKSLSEIALFANRPDLPTDAAKFGTPRVCREVATERDLLNVHGTFYELPARNAQGVAKIRPVATHNLAIHDFCSHNGLLLISGIDTAVANPRIFRSADGKAAIWAGVVDDLWKLGKPRGHGGPWSHTAVQPNEPSDPYLMTAYDRKSVTISSSSPASIRLEVDVDGTGVWITYRSFDLTAGETIEHTFPEGYSAYWVRAVSDSATTATVMFTYD